MKKNSTFKLQPGILTLWGKSLKYIGHKRPRAAMKIVRAKWTDFYIIFLMALIITEKKVNKNQRGKCN